MKKRFLLLIVIPIALLVWWFIVQRPTHDPHYDAAACAAVTVLGAPTSDRDFADKIRTVIVNENSSYSIKQVEYDEQLGRSSIEKYQALSADRKAEAAKDVDTCINVMAAGH